MRACVVRHNEGEGSGGVAIDISMNVASMKRYGGGALSCDLSAESRLLPARHRPVGESLSARVIDLRRREHARKSSLDA